MAKVKVTLSVEEQKVKDLKKKAIDQNITLSDLFAVGGTTVTPTQIKVFKQQIDISGKPTL